MHILEIKDLPATFQYAGQALTKNSKGLFIQPLGTERLYEWKGNQHQGEWKRIDSTFFTGYNFLSLFFSLDSTIYSFGGIGFWYQNGNLRKYGTVSHEWTAKLLNHSIPWHKKNGDIFQIDSSNRALYFNGVGRPYDANLKNQVDSSSLNKMYRLDLDQGELTELGQYDPEIGEFHGQTPWGVIINFSELADLVNNKRYKFSENVESNILRVLTKSTSNRFSWQYIFWMDSAMYFATPDKGYDSVIIHKSDLIPIKGPVYTEIKKEIKTSDPSSTRYLLLFICCLFGVGNLWFYRKYKTVKKKNTLDASAELKSEFLASEKNKLSEIDKSLLQLVFENSVMKKMTTISEINTVLGCVNKSIEIQKRMRSDAINAINQKMNFSLLTDERIIERQRSAFDARSFEYYINEKYFLQIKNLLN